MWVVVGDSSWCCRDAGDACAAVEYRVHSTEYGVLSTKPGAFDAQYSVLCTGCCPHRPRPLTDAEIAATPAGLFNQYARDPQIVIGKHIIETNLRMMFRCKEHLGYEQLFRTRLTEDLGTARAHARHDSDFAGRDGGGVPQ